MEALDSTPNDYCYLQIPTHYFEQGCSLTNTTWYLPLLVAIVVGVFLALCWYHSKYGFTVAEASEDCEDSKKSEGPAPAPAELRKSMV